MLTLWLSLAAIGPACTRDDAGKTTETGATDTQDTSETGAPDTDDTDDTEDTEEETDTDTAGNYCADVPTVTYESFGRGFLTANCQGCHASTAADRYDAPEDVTFDTVEEVWAQAELVLIVASTYSGLDPTMPPQGGVTEDDQTRLQWWLRCAEPGT